MGRFRIKAGDVEIEYEGEDSDEKYPSALEYIRGFGPAPGTDKGHQKKAESPKGESKSSKRGGQRSAVVSPKIDELISEGWFSKHRSVPDIVAELKRRVVPGVNELNVLAACKRRVKSKDLDTIMDNDVQVLWATKKPQKPAT